MAEALTEDDLLKEDKLERMPSFHLPAMAPQAAELSSIPA